MKKLFGNVKLWALAMVAGVVGLFTGAASAQEYTPTALSIPQVVDWSATITAVLTVVGAAFLLIMGLILAFRISRRLLSKIGKTV
jgi:hydrogenase/urease accessory protein HupE